MTTIPHAVDSRLSRDFNVTNNHALESMFVITLNGQNIVYKDKIPIVKMWDEIQKYEIQNIWIE